MTHDELLKDIKDNADYGLNPPDPDPIAAALIAVVELHSMGKTIEKKLPNTEYTIGYFICVACSHIADKPIAYPCPTIQAIEKEYV